MDRLNSFGISRFIAKISCCLFGICFTPHGMAQKCGANAQSALATDRPQITNSSVVVPCGSLQFENGFQVTSTGGVRSPDLPETSVRLGVAKRTELRFGVPNYIRDDGSISGADGFGDLSVGLKQQLGPVGGFDLSLIPSLSLPTGANSISSHGYDPTVQLPWSRALTKSWTAAGQFGVTWPTQSGRRKVAGQASLYVDRQLTSPWDAYVEYAGVFAERGAPEHLIDFGTAYKPSPHQQLDLHCELGLSSAAPDYSIGLGYSFRVQLKRAQ